LERMRNGKCLETPLVPEFPPNREIRGPKGPNLKVKFFCARAFKQLGET